MESSLGCSNEAAEDLHARVGAVLELSCPRDSFPAQDSEMQPRESATWVLHGTQETKLDWGPRAQRPSTVPPENLTKEACFLGSYAQSTRRHMLASDAYQTHGIVSA